MKTQQIIETERLRLLPFIASGKRKTENAIISDCITASQSDIQQTQNKETNEFVNYAIVLKPQNETIGMVGLIIDTKLEQAELGYRIHKIFRNKGLCTEAAKALIDYSFKNYNLCKIIATHSIKNHASEKVMQKIGMKLEKTIRSSNQCAFKMDDVNIYGISKNTWKTNSF